MSKSKLKLSALEVQKLKSPGRYSDGDGLYLQITKSGVKSWLFIFKINQKQRSMGLGPLRDLSLSEARKRARECRLELAQGNDPIESRKARKRLSSEARTFDQCADAYIEGHKSGWKNLKHCQQWENTLKTYASPILGSKPIQDIEIEDVVRVLEPIWTEKTETASRVRNRIKKVIDWALAMGFRTGDNPARTDGPIDALLPPKAKVMKVRHQPALPIHEMPMFMEQLRNKTGQSCRALEFLILTATRTSEVRLAKWSEISMKDRMWIIPAERMKSKKEHRIPLSDSAMAVLKYMQMFNNSEQSYVFPGARKGRPLSSMAMLEVIRGMDLKHEVVTHGFRSTFRDWADEVEEFPRDVIEKALAHTIKNKSEAAYKRGDLYLKRVPLMNSWASFCSSKVSNKSLSVC